MPIKILEHKLVEIVELQYSDWNEVLEKYPESEGWCSVPQDSSRYITLQRDCSRSPSGFTIIMKWPGGDDAGTYSYHSNADNWRDATLEAVESMHHESEGLGEGDEITIDDVFVGEAVTAEGADRYATVSWKGGKAQWVPSL